MMTTTEQRTRLHVVAATRDEIQILPAVRSRIVGEFCLRSTVAQLGNRYRGIGRRGVEDCLREALIESRYRRAA